MKIKVFSFQKPYFSSWRILAAQMEKQIQDWLQQNPRIAVKEIRHDSYQGIWYAPQLIVTIYYD